MARKGTPGCGPRQVADPGPAVDPNGAVTEIGNRAVERVAERHHGFGMDDNVRAERPAKAVVRASTDRSFCGQSVLRMTPWAAMHFDPALCSRWVAM